MPSIRSGNYGAAFTEPLFRERLMLADIKVRAHRGYYFRFGIGTAFLSLSLSLSLFNSFVNSDSAYRGMHDTSLN